MVTLCRLHDSLGQLGRQPTHQPTGKRHQHQIMLLARASIENQKTRKKPREQGEKKKERPELVSIGKKKLPPEDRKGRNEVENQEA